MLQVKQNCRNLKEERKEGRGGRERNGYKCLISLRKRGFLLWNWANGERDSG